MLFKVFEDFLSDKELQDVNHVIENLSWKYREYSVSPKNGTIFWSADINDKKLTDVLIPKIEKVSNKKFELLKIYANGQTYGQDGSFHKDHEDEGTYTFLIYMSPITESNFKDICGCTDFFVDDIMLSVEPYRGRGVLFDSRIIHRGRAPLTKDMLRISIAIKLKEI